MQLPAKEHTGSHLLALHGVLVFPYHFSTHRHLKGKVEYTLTRTPYMNVPTKLVRAKCNIDVVATKLHIMFLLSFAAYEHMG